MSTLSNGGPAFPCFKGENCYAESGMSLRDWFAGQALNGSLASDQPNWKACSNESLAKGAYEIADAMLAERAKGATQ